MVKYYKPATPAKLGGGSFKNKGQKEGKKALNKKESDKNREAGVHAKIRKISKAMFAKKAIVNQHAQGNA